MQALAWKKDFSGRVHRSRPDRLFALPRSVEVVQVTGRECDVVHTGKHFKNLIDRLAYRSPFHHQIVKLSTSSIAGDYLGAKRGSPVSTGGVSPWRRYHPTADLVNDDTRKPRRRGEPARMSKARCDVAFPRLPSPHYRGRREIGHLGSKVGGVALMN